MQVAGKVAIVTGAAKGLGKAFAKSLVKNGAKACVSDYDVTLGEETSKEFNKEFGAGSSSFVRCDVSRQQDIKDMFEEVKRKYGKIDIMVNNAGIANETHVEHTVDINLKGVIYGSLLAIESMRTDQGGNGGVIVNTASAAGLLPVNYAPVYSATKHGVVAFTRSWAKNPLTTNNGVRMVCLCPAYVDTDMIKPQKLPPGHKPTPDDILNYKLLQESLKMFGIMSVDTVVEGFEKLITDTDNHGKALLMSTVHKMTYS